MLGRTNGTQHCRRPQTLSHGSKISIPRPTKSLTLRVATVRPCTGRLPRSGRQSRPAACRAAASGPTVSPAIGDGLRDGQQPSLKGAPQILFEPFFQSCPPVAGLAEFDALPNFSECYNACEKETILGVG